eukprot:6191220-Pleurochrysis_carterae.AAC.1
MPSLPASGTSHSAHAKGSLTPLVCAVQSGDASLVGLLLERKADPDAKRSADNRTALMVAAQSGMCAHGSSPAKSCLVLASKPVPVWA